MHAFVYLHMVAYYIFNIWGGMLSSILTVNVSQTLYVNMKLKTEESRIYRIFYFKILFEVMSLLSFCCVLVFGIMVCEMLFT